MTDIDENGTSSTSHDLGTVAARGALWMLIASGFNKIVTLGGQWALAWFLVPDDYGIVAMAMSAAWIASFLTAGSLQPVLVNRGTDFDAFASDAFWLSITIGLTSAVCTAALAQVASIVFHDDRALWILLVVAAAALIASPRTVYAAKLKTQLRFRAIATVQFAEGILHTGGVVILAMLDFGPYALVLPMLWVRAFSVLALRYAAGSIPIRKPSARLWGQLLAPALWVMLWSNLESLHMHGTNLVIGLMHGAAITGLYAWGYQFSTQATFFLATNLRVVLFPTLTTLNDDKERQVRACRQAAQALLAICIPICILQGSLAGTYVPLLFPDRWLDAVPVIQWFSVAMASLPLSILGVSLLLAHGRFRDLALLTCLVGLTAMGAALVAARVGAQTEIAAAVSVSLALGHLVLFSLAVRGLGVTFSEAVRTVSRPILAAVPGQLLALAALALPSSAHPLARLIGVTVCVGVVHAGAVRWLCPEILGRLRSVVMDRLPARAAATP
ncbi:MAG: oligosaccharide flippase family protein [Verrucomicrobia bacterium]|nr:oligosaccharide flippase family protein [Verrucomicrobiota bacterium]MDA1087232.1 oligosaccharide flippase family protein [Verrucomicrobiota bacterium]